jgi:CelD/BcsL family acetyltransferase involved in cellulose biosynthesis
MQAGIIDSERGSGDSVQRNHLTVRVIDTLDELDKLRPAWEELLSNYPQASIFSTWEWLAPWWRAFGEGQQLHVLAFEDASARLVALAPLSITTRKAFGMRWKVMLLMGDGSHDSDNLDIPVIPGYEDEVVRLLLSHLEAHAHLWDFCEFNTLPSDSLGAKSLLSLFATSQYVWRLGQTPRACIMLPDNWDDYLKQLPSRIRTQYRSLARKFEGQNRLRFYRCSQQSNLDSCLETLFELHGKRWNSRGESGTFSLQARRRFYRDLSAGLLQRNWLEFWLLELDGKPIAADYGFRYRNIVYNLQAGFDPSHADDRPGFWLKGNMLKALIESGVRRYDFLGGYSDAKARWNASPSNYVYIHFGRTWSVGGLRLRFRTRGGRSKEWLRTHLPARAWKVLHGLNAAVKVPRNS